MYQICLYLLYVVYIQLKWNPNNGLLTKQGKKEYQPSLEAEELSNDKDVTIYTILDRELETICRHHYQEEVKRRKQKQEQEKRRKIRSRRNSVYNP